MGDGRKVVVLELDEDTARVLLLVCHNIGGPPELDQPRGRMDAIGVELRSLGIAPCLAKPEGGITFPGSPKSETTVFAKLVCR